MKGYELSTIGYELSTIEGIIRLEPHASGLMRVVISGPFDWSYNIDIFLIKDEVDTITVLITKWSALQ
jgi:hypothetical protein